MRGRVIWEVAAFKADVCCELKSKNLLRLTMVSKFRGTLLLT